MRKVASWKLREVCSRRSWPKTSPWEAKPCQDQPGGSKATVDSNQEEEEEKEAGWHKDRGSAG